jgi:hypothetical protein
MKPFDLEKFKALKPAVTRDGRQARFLGIVNNRQEDNIVVAVKDHGGNEDVKFYHPSGKYFEIGDSPVDLLMASEKKEGWIVMNRNSLHDVDNVVTREQAEKIAAARQKRCSGPDGYWKVVHITWEE